jgi:hypothetical protein
MQLVHDGLDVASHCGRIEFIGNLGRFTLAARIHGDDTEIAGEESDLLFSDLCWHDPTRNEKN